MPSGKDMVTKLIANAMKGKKNPEAKSLASSRIFKAHGSSLKVLQLLSASIFPVGKYISYIFLLLLVPCFTYFVL